MSEATNGSSNTGQKRKPGTFTKGDPRINRHGRPKNFDAARAIFQAVANEEITDKSGNKLLVIEAIARKWAVSPEPTLQKAFVEYCFGKVPDKHEIGAGDDAAIVILRHAHEEFEPSRS